MDSVSPVPEGVFRGGEVLRLSIAGALFLAAGCTCFNDLHRAALANDAAGVDAAVKRGFDPNCVDFCGNETPLAAAARAGATQAIRALVRDGADPNRTASTSGELPLASAAAFGQLASIQTLLELGAALRGRDAEGRTALFWAVRDNEPRAVALLLKLGADPHDEMDGGAYLARWAHYWSEPSVLAALRSHGLQVEAGPRPDP